MKDIITFKAVGNYLAENQILTMKRGDICVNNDIRKIKMVLFNGTIYKKRAWLISVHAFFIHNKSRKFRVNEYRCSYGFLDGM